MSYAEVTLAGVFPDQVMRMHFLTRTIIVEHFPPELQNFYKLMIAYFTLTGGVPEPKEWRSMLQRDGVEPAVREKMEATYRKLWELAGQEDHAWQFALEAMKTDRQTELFIEALTEGMRVLTEGLTNRKGERVYGYRAAYAVLTKRLGEIDQLQANADALPEGNVMIEGAEVWDDYKLRKTEGAHIGVQTGFVTLDNLTFGVQRGEFWLMAAYAGHGKSQTLSNMGYQAVMDGRNVVYLTLETLRDQVRRRFIARHSSHPKFESEGLYYNDIKSGSLTPEGEAKLKVVLDDLKGSDYGRFEVVWMPRGSSPDQVKMKMDILEALFPIDLVIVDYAGLMGAGRRVEHRREGLTEVLQGLKGLATGHHRGRGVPLVSAYQTSRVKLQEARKEGGYTLDSLAETAEAERSADLVLTLLRQHDEDTELRAQVLKYRDGRMIEFTLETDFSRSIVTESEIGAADESFTSLFSE